MSAITFQINLCPGDINYARLTVPYLVKLYRHACAEVLAVVDCCPPQATQFVNAGRLFSPTEFARRVTELENILAEWQQENLLDRVIYLRPGCDLIPALSQNYLQGIVQETHDAYGHALMSYMAALGEPQTQYVLHFDADILMYCEPSAGWLKDAIDQLQSNPTLLAVSPRICPPLPNSDPTIETTPSTSDHPESGWLSTWQAQHVPGGWLSDWISTRCFLLDRARLQAMGALISSQEVVSTRQHAWIHRWGRRFADGAWLGSLGDLPQLQPSDSLTRRLPNILKHRVLPIYPQPPEVMLHSRMREHELKCLYLSRGDVWYVHPTTKPKRFLDLLPSLLRSIEQNDYPLDQCQFSEIRVDSWERHLRLGICQ